jgi:hypothetical protein
MGRVAALTALVLGLAGCGGSPDVPDEPRPGPAPGLRFAADLRSADARSPLVRVDGGAWRCETGGRFHLAVSAQGEVALSIDGGVLASFASPRTLINRACEPEVRRRAPRAPGRAAHGRVGASAVTCLAAAVVVIDFRGGDVTVRAPGGALLAAAAVRSDRVGVAAYWSERCALA